jgi:hypothetical protein
LQSGKPVTAMILLYSIKTLSFLKAQDTLTGALKKIEQWKIFVNSRQKGAGFQGESGFTVPDQPNLEKIQG